MSGSGEYLLRISWAASNRPGFRLAWLRFGSTLIGFYWIVRHYTWKALWLPGLSIEWSQNQDPLRDGLTIRLFGWPLCGGWES